VKILHITIVADGKPLPALQKGEPATAPADKPVAAPADTAPPAPAIKQAAPPSGN
jgi:hypothetical protein